MKRIPIVLTIALIAALLRTATHAQTTLLPVDPDLVYVRATAIEPTRNRPIRGLNKEHFKVFENNAAQDIVYFSDEDLPLHMGILLDSSGTATDELARAASGMNRAATRNDDFLLLEPGKAPLHEAVLQALDTLARRGNNGKRALLLVTSKREPHAYPLTKVRERLRDLDIPLYVIALQTGSDALSENDRQALTELTERTGGAAYFPSSLAFQTDIFKKIVAQLRNQYLIGYRTSNRATDGKWRKIKITGEYPDRDTGKLRKADVLAKKGYYAPAAPR